MKTLLKLSMLSMLFALASCGGGGSSGGGSTYGTYYSPNILASEFVSALNSEDGTYSSRVEVYSNQTLRSAVAGQGGFNP